MKPIAHRPAAPSPRPRTESGSRRQREAVAQARLETQALVQAHWADSSAWERAMASKPPDFENLPSSGKPRLGRDAHGELAVAHAHAARGRRSMTRPRRSSDQAVEDHGASSPRALSNSRGVDPSRRASELQLLDLLLAAAPGRTPACVDASWPTVATVSPTHGRATACRRSRRSRRARTPAGSGSAARRCMAERTGLEPATPGVTGRYSNQLNYRSTVCPFHWALPGWWVLRGSNPRHSPCKGDALPAELSTQAIQHPFRIARGQFGAPWRGRVV
jgi:hypothetical protein